jgi:hypothetical protein
MREVRFDPDQGILREGAATASALNRSRRDTPSLSARPDTPLEHHLQQIAAPIAFDGKSEMLNCARRNIANHTADSRSSLKAHDDFSITFAVDCTIGREAILELFQSGHLAAKLQFR